MIKRAVTNADGRTDLPLLSGAPIPIASYELRFAVSDYFARQGAPMADPPFLGVVPIRFAVAEPEGGYHVPLSSRPGPIPPIGELKSFTASVDRLGSSSMAAVDLRGAFAWTRFR